MRSDRLDLAEVIAQFGEWRANREERGIPEELLDAAVGLLGEHSASAICRALRLNSTRFKRAREAREARSKRRSAGGARRRRRTKAERASSTLTTGGGGFVELAPARWDGGWVRPRVKGAAPGWQLSLENGSGTVTIIMRAPDAGLVAAVRRQLLTALSDA